jgi:hypothetical protein
MALTYRQTKGSALTIAELDANFQFFTGSQSITGSLVLTGDVTASNIKCTGNSTTTGTNVVSSSLIVTGSSTVIGTSIISGSLRVTGSSTLIGTSTISGSLTATGSSTLIGTSIISGSLTVNGTISSSLIPAGPYTNNTSSYNLGSPTAAWKDLYLSNGTIYLLAQSGNSASIAYNNTTNAFTFTNSDGLPTTLYDGGVSAGAALNYTGSNFGVDLYFTGSNFRRNNLCVITNNANNNVTLNIPPAFNYSPGTVVEFDIIAATGSTWQINTVDETGSLIAGFVTQQNPGAALPADALDYQDFNAFWNNNPANPTFANHSSYFPALVGGGLFTGSALVRLVALHAIAELNDTTNFSGSSDWFGRIIQRGF